MSTFFLQNHFWATFIDIWRLRRRNSHHLGKDVPDVADGESCLDPLLHLLVVLVVDSKNVVQVWEEAFDQVLGHLGGVNQGPEEKTFENLQVSDVTAFRLEKF